MQLGLNQVNCQLKQIQHDPSLHNIMFIVSRGYNPKSHGLREEHLFPSQGKRQFTEPNSEVVPLLGVSEEDFRAATITVPVKIKEKKNSQ